MTDWADAFRKHVLPSFEDPRPCDGWSNWTLRRDFASDGRPLRLWGERAAGNKTVDETMDGVPVAEGAASAVGGITTTAGKDMRGTGSGAVFATGRCSTGPGVRGAGFNFWFRLSSELIRQQRRVGKRVAL
jgi:hypothetical protein